MIFSAFINIILDIISTLVGFLPNVTANTSFVSAITTGSHYISGVYGFIPLTTITLLAIIAFDIVFESSYMLYKVIYWVIRRFPTQS